MQSTLRFFGLQLLVGEVGEGENGYGGHSDSVQENEYVADDFALPLDGRVVAIGGVE